MGLFDKFTPQASAFPSDEREAILFMLFGAIRSDGSISEEETWGLSSLVTKSRTMGAWPNDKFKESLRNCMNMWKGEQCDEVLRRCKALISPDLRESVFMNLCGLVLVDNEFTEKEITFIELSQQALGLDDDRARALVDAMVVLKRL